MDSISIAAMLAYWSSEVITAAIASAATLALWWIGFYAMAML
jgi:hypothetical protein